MNYISEHATVLSAMGIFFPFLLSAILKSAHGSSTVASLVMGIAAIIEVAILTLFIH